MSDMHRMKVQKNKMEDVFDLLNKAEDSKMQSSFNVDHVLKAKIVFALQKISASLESIDQKLKPQD